MRADVTSRGAVSAHSASALYEGRKFMNYIGKYLGDLGGLAGKYSSVLMIIGLIFALLNCFLGYKLRKVWITLAGALVGAAGGAAAGYYFLKDVKLAAAIALGGAVLLAVFAFHIYRLGLFILCGGLTFWMLAQGLSADSSMARGICIAAGVVVGVMALQYERIIVILTTGICGGVGASRLLFTMTGKGGTFLIVLVGLILAVLGILFQYQLGTKKGQKEFQEDSQSLFQRNGKKRSRSKRRRKSLRDYLPSRRKKKKKKRGKSGGSQNDGSSGSRQTRTAAEPSDSNARNRKQDRDRRNPETSEEDQDKPVLTGNAQSSSQMGYENPLDMDEIAKLISKDVKEIYRDQEEP